MAEAEDVIVDAARHATVYTRELWRRHRGGEAAPPRPLDEAGPRIELLLAAVFGRRHRLLAAEPPAPATWLARWLAPGAPPQPGRAVPATDGCCIWLPAQGEGADTLRLLALQQAERAERGAPRGWQSLADELERSVFAVFEADAADRALVERLPGTRPGLQALRQRALRERPAVADARRAPLAAGIEDLLRKRLTAPLGDGLVPSPAAVLAQARAVAAALRARAASTGDSTRRGGFATLRAGRAPRGGAAATAIAADAWLGEWRPPPADAQGEAEPVAPGTAPAPPLRSARLPRSPRARQAAEDEDDAKPGAWMVQTAQPHEQAEDPAGLQRPSDRDEATPAGEFADALSELPQARLVSTPEPAREVLLSESLVLPRRPRDTADATADPTALLNYPEWDWRRQAYRDPGATVHVLAAAEGPQSWVDATLAQHAPLVRQVQRRFESLRPQRLHARRQLEGDDIDLDACIEARVDFGAGLPLPQGLYRQLRPTRRDTAVLVLADASGSTDSWVSAGRRIVDVEREALLLVAIALQRLGEPYAAATFSGTGPQGVVVRVLKGFDEPAGTVLARRIAGIEPEQHTRAGAALRHASAMLLRQPAQHRLLLLLSDGKPNDVDAYEGRYGVEDMRQAVVEARLQGLHPFCMTVDRQAADYLPGIFGAQGCALLPRPDRLPIALLQWLQRIVRD